MSDLSHITTQDMAQAAGEELRRREGTYPLDVSKGKMTDEQAADGIEAMKAIYYKLQNLAYEEQGQGDLF